MKYKAVLFDMDGVILDSEPLHFTAAKIVFKQRGHNLTEANYKKYFGGQTNKEGFEQYCQIIGCGQLAESIAAEKTQVYLDIAASTQLTACPGSLELIKWLDDNQIPAALVTGSLRHEAEIVLKAFDIGHLFKAVVAAEDVASGKPHPEGYLMAAKTLNVSPAHCVVIEDAPSGIKAAVSAGMPCIAVTATYPVKVLSDATLIVDKLHHKYLNEVF